MLALPNEQPGLLRSGGSPTELRTAWHSRPLCTDHPISRPLLSFSQVFAVMAEPSSGGLPAEAPVRHEGQWGLRFESSSGDVEDLEQAFLAARSAAHQATAAVLSAGLASRG